MASAEISVELTLLLANLQKQAKAAAAIIGKELGADMSKATASTDKATDSQNKLTKAVKNTNKELQELARLSKIPLGELNNEQLTKLRKAGSERYKEWENFKPPTASTPVPGLLPDSTMSLDQMNAARAKHGLPPLDMEGAAQKGGEAGRTALAGYKKRYPDVQVPVPEFKVQPTKPTIPSGSKTGGGSFSMSGLSALSASGIPYISTLARAIFSPLGAAAALTAASILAMRSAIENARTIYTKSLTSGMGLGMSIKRGTLANAIGVSEAELFQFGSAIAYLQPKLRGAQEILNQTTMPLTQVSFEFQVLKANMGALFAKMTAEAAPALLKLADSLGIFVKAATDSIGTFSKVMNVTKWAQPLYLFHRLTQGIANSINGVNQKQVDAGIGGAMPSPMAYMKQMPASNWERMGLVIGGGGGTNYNQQTAKNTGTMTKTLEQILRAFTASKAHYNAQGLPSTP